MIQKHLEEFILVKWAVFLYVSPKRDKAGLGFTLQLQALRRPVYSDVRGPWFNKTRIHKNHSSSPRPKSTWALKGWSQMHFWAWVQSILEKLPFAMLPQGRDSFKRWVPRSRSWAELLRYSRFPWHSKPLGPWLLWVQLLGFCLQHDQRKKGKQPNGSTGIWLPGDYVRLVTYYLLCAHYEQGTVHSVQTYLIALSSFTLMGDSLLLFSS